MKNPNPIVTIQEYPKTEQKENWLAKKERIKRQMEDTCRKYGASLNFSAPRTNLLYDKKDNLL